MYGIFKLRSTFGLWVTRFCIGGVLGAVAFMALGIWRSADDDCLARDVIKEELGYFAAAQHPSGLFVDHVRFDGCGRMTRGEYHAASRAGFQIAVLLKILQGTPGFECGWRKDASHGRAKDEARTVLAAALATLEHFQLAHPSLRGFIPWGRLDNAGLVADVETRNRQPCIKLPAVDQGILAFALAAATAHISRSMPSPARRSAGVRLWQSPGIKSGERVTRRESIIMSPSGHFPCGAAEWWWRRHYS